MSFKIEGQLTSALIGYTGFVGSNIERMAQKSGFRFSDHYNSQNIGDIKDKKYDLVVSAGTKGVRYLANQNPGADWQGIKNLLDNLVRVAIGHLVLVSTVDVYPNPSGALEDTPIDENDLTQAYGRNRYKMERFMVEHFPSVTVLRCPQLYGPGLKKNFIYDLIHLNALDWTHKDTSLQFYNMGRFWHDLQVILQAGIPLMNLAVEPLTASDIAREAADMDFETVTQNPPLVFDMRTRFGHLFGSQDDYIYHRDEILADIKRFIEEEKAKLKQ